MRYLKVLCMMLICVIGFLTVSSSVYAAEKLSTVKSVRMSETSDTARIVVDVSDEVEYKTMVLASPNRVVVDLKKAKIDNGVKKEYALQGATVSKVRVAQFDKETVRVVIETDVKKDGYKIFPLNGQNGSRIVMDFKRTGAAGVSNSTEKVTINLPDVKKREDIQPVEEKEQPQEKSKNEKKREDKEKQSEKQSKEDAKDNVEEWTRKNLPELDDDDDDDTEKTLSVITGMRGKVITLDPGHGGSDSGAIGPTGVMEKNIALRVAKEVRRLLEAEGATVHMTREKDTEVAKKGAKATDIEELQARCDVANESGSDVFISIHMDAFTNPAAKGTTGYYYSLGSRKSRDLADKVRAGVVESLNTQSRGTQSATFYVLKHTNMPATLVEVAFLSNESEEKMLDSEEGIKKAAQGIADGIADYFG